MVSAIPTQMPSVRSPGLELETPPTVSIILRSRSLSLMTVHLLTFQMSPHTTSSMPLFQGVHNVYMPHATFTVAENVSMFHSVNAI